MKYFNKEYINAELSDNEFYKRNAAYEKEWLQILSIALPTVKEFMESVSLHDGKINSIERIEEKIEIHLEYGDNQTGHHRIIVQFFDASTNYNQYIKLPFEILYDEYSYKEKYCLKFVNKNCVEWEIQFSNINISKFDN